jgi:hypothetical protein
MKKKQEERIIILKKRIKKGRKGEERKKKKKKKRKNTKTLPSSNCRSKASTHLLLLLSGHLPYVPPVIARTWL